MVIIFEHADSGGHVYHVTQCHIIRLEGESESCVVNWGLMILLSDLNKTREAATTSEMS